MVWSPRQIIVWAQSNINSTRRTVRPNHRCCCCCFLLLLLLLLLLCVCLCSYRMDNLGVNRSLKYSNNTSTSSFTSTTAGSTAAWSFPFDEEEDDALSVCLLLPPAPAVALVDEGGGDAGNTGMRRRFAGKSSITAAPPEVALLLALALPLPLEDGPLSAALSEPLSLSRFTLKLLIYARTSATKAPTDR